MGIKMTMAMALLAIAVSPMAGAAPVAQWVDPATGHRVLRLTHKPGSASLYFHQNSYTSQGDITALIALLHCLRSCFASNPARELLPYSNFIAG
ncbi:MAG: hypothetical protein QM680_05425 [Luteolibacter sp.]